MTIEMEFARVRQQFMSDYQNLREYFLEKAQARISPSVLDTLKVTYSGVINSARNSDYIVSLEGLLRMLEKRGALSYDDIEPLKHISSTYVEDPALERALRDYEARIGRRSPLPRCNVYEILGASAPRLEERPGVSGVQTIFNESRPRGIQAEMTLYTTQPAFQLTLPGSILLGPTNSRRSLESNSEDARMVLLRISEELGRSWRDVARHLGVRERDIDEIDHKHNVTLKEKAFQALQIFHNKCDPLQWKRKLKRALDEARRRDLMEMVDELVERSRSN